MPLWTKKHTIPIVLDSCLNARSIVFEGKLWTVCDVCDFNNHPYQTRVFVLDSDLEDFTEINCIYPNNWELHLHALITTETDLYMMRTQDVDPDTDHHLYKFNRATLEWESVVKINRYNDWMSVVIINQIMYVLERSDHYTNYLLTVDLSRGELLKEDALCLRSGNEFLASHNATLYMTNIGDYRKVFEIKDGVPIEIAQEERKMTDNFFAPAHCSNECVGYACMDEHLLFEARIFDFESLKWESVITHPDWMRDFTVRVKSVVKMNGLIYTLLWIPQERRLELHVLDLHPKLTSICLAELTNHFSEEEDAQKLEGVKQQLPIPMRAKLEELLKTKREANE